MAGNRVGSITTVAERKTVMRHIGISVLLLTLLGAAPARAQPDFTHVKLRPTSCMSPNPQELR